MAGLRDVVAMTGAVVPIEVVRRARWLPGRALLLRLGNDRLRRFPRTFNSTTTDAGVVVGIDTSDLIERYLYVFGTWEPSLGAFLRGQLRPGDVFVDIGANVGYFTMLAAQAVAPGGEVYAFEPVPQTVAKLRANIDANQLTNVHVAPAAVSDAAGEIEMFVGPPTNRGKSSTAPVAHGTSVGRVDRVVAADAIPRTVWPRIRAIKVDVEGDELRVLRGLRPILDALPVGACVVVEVAPDRLSDRGSSATEIFELMTSAAFRPATLANEYHPSHYARPRIARPRPLGGLPVSITDVVFTKTF